MTYSRRDLCLLAAALAATPGRAAQNTPLHSKAYSYEALPVKKMGDNEQRPILEGELHKGFYLEVHETRLEPGTAPHPPHHHAHEEMFLIKEGTLEVMIAGKTTRLGPGSLGFVGSNDEHGVTNIGATHAQYFVVALGNDA